MSVKFAGNTIELKKIASIKRESIKPNQILKGTMYLGMEHISSTGEFEAIRIDKNELKSNKFSFNQQDILYGKLRPYLKKIALPNFVGICSTDILPIVPNLELVDRSYLYRLLRSDKLVNLANSKCGGANLPRISPKSVLELPIPLPPLPIQKKIAAILDAADAYRQKTKALIDKYDELTQSLFLDMFGANKHHSIAELIDKSAILVHKDGNHGGNYPRKSDFGDEGVPFISAKHIDDNGNFVPIDVPLLSNKKAKKITFGWIKKGDVLLSHNASVGKVNLYDGVFELAIIGTSLTCYRVNTDYLNPSFLASFFRSVKFQRQLKLNMGQTTRNQVPITAQRKLKIPVPPLTLQNQFADLVQSIEAQKKLAQASLEKSEALFQSLLQRAFKGELTRRP